MSLFDFYLPPLTLSMIIFAIGLALLLDTFFGEPKRFHPLIGFGKITAKLETFARQLKLPLKFSGFLAWLLAVLPVVIVITVLLNQLALLSQSLFVFVSSCLLYLTIGGASLRLHAMAIYQPLAQGDLKQARAKVAMMVSRDTAQMQTQAITSATIESVLENGNDAVFAAIFWFILFGAPGAIAFRLVNTLDAMWGYKTERYVNFGYTAAKLDDALGYIPARLTGLTYALQGQFSLAMSCWRSQAKHCISPNGGVVMSAGAGALHCKIGGPAIYHGQLKNKIYMGCGDVANHSIIPQACQLVNRGAWLWLAVLVLMYGLASIADGSTSLISELL